MENKEKLCFVIGPIGEPGSPTRTLADWLLKGIIKPVVEAEEFGFTVLRADEVSTPGSISADVIGKIIDAAIVIADMTGPNPNAFYELGIAHMEERPVIHMIHDGETIPFDNFDQRAIRYATKTFEDIEASKKYLAEAVRETLKPGFKVTNPVTLTRAIKALPKSKDSKDGIIARLLEQMTDLQRRVGAIELPSVSIDSKATLIPRRLSGEEREHRARILLNAMKLEEVKPEYFVMNNDDWININREL